MHQQRARAVVNFHTVREQEGVVVDDGDGGGRRWDVCEDVEVREGGGFGDRPLAGGLRDVGIGGLRAVGKAGDKAGEDARGEARAAEGDMGA